MKGKYVIRVILMFSLIGTIKEYGYVKKVEKENVNVNVTIKQEVQKDERKDREETFKVIDKGIVKQGYTIQIGDKSGMLSRDGSEAIEVQNGQVIEEPGTYFMTTWDQKEEQLAITRWQIENGEWKEAWMIEAEEQLEEILKQALEEYRSDFSIQFNYGTFTLEEINEVLFEKVKELMNKYPKLTFESYTLIGRSGENPEIGVKIAYPIEEREEWLNYEQVLEERLITILNEQLTSKMLDYEREWALYCYLIQEVSYSAQMISGVKEIIDTPMTHTMYGGLVDGVAVCDGYAKSLMYLLNAAGIPATLITGTAEGTAHVWNRVEIGNQNYHVDATWGDLEQEQIGGFYNYFNEADEYMVETHWWDNKDIVCDESRSNLVYLPIEIKNLDRVHNKEEWEEVKESLKEKEQQSICFYNQNQNGWDVRELISEICFSVEESIEYNVVEKYDNIIINYEVYDNKAREP